MSMDHQPRQLNEVERCVEIIRRLPVSSRMRRSVTSSCQQRPSTAYRHPSRPGTASTASLSTVYRLADGRLQGDSYSLVKDSRWDATRGSTSAGRRQHFQTTGYGSSRSRPQTVPASKTFARSERISLDRLQSAKPTTSSCHVWMSSTEFSDIWTGSAYPTPNPSPTPSLQDELAISGSDAVTNAWPYMVDFRYPDGPYRIGDRKISKIHWDELTKTWIAQSNKPQHGWYLKFATGLPIDERDNADVIYRAISSCVPPRSSCPRYSSHASNRDDGYCSATSGDLQSPVVLTKRRSVKANEQNGRRQRNSGPVNSSKKILKTSESRQRPESSDADLALEANGCERDTSTGDAKGDLVDKTDGSQDDHEDNSLQDISNDESAQKDETQDSFKEKRQLNDSVAAKTSLSRLTSDNDDRLSARPTEDSATNTEHGRSSLFQQSTFDGNESSAEQKLEEENGDLTKTAGSDGEGGEPSDESSPKSTQQQQDRSRRPTVKKERKPFDRRRTKDGDAINRIHGPWRKVPDWIYGSEDFSTPLARTRGNRQTQMIIVPQMDKKPTGGDAMSGSADDDTPRDEQEVNVTSDRSARDAEALLKRRRLARRRAQLRHAKMMKNNILTADADSDTGMSDDYDWLAKYCIVNPDKIEFYSRTFDAVDEKGTGHLDCLDTMVALRAINPYLTDADEEYMYTILQIVGYNVTSGADYRLLAIIASLSFRIVAVDDWMRRIIVNTDCRTLVSKLWKCKSLWACCIEPGATTISIDQLCVELCAGGVHQDHVDQVRRRLGPPRHPLDLLDFITYMPLFIMIHQSVVDHPLNDVRDK